VADELADPLSYSAVWSWLLLALILVPVAIVFFRFALAWNARRAGRISPRDALRRHALSQIGELERQYDAGELSARQAHSELSRLVRAFVSAASSTPAEAMTLLELERATDSEPLISAVRTFYNGAFESHPTSVVVSSAALAREVVAEWS
jgi:hypothetical protein